MLLEPAVDFSSEACVISEVFDDCLFPFFMAVVVFHGGDIHSSVLMDMEASGSFAVCLESVYHVFA